MVNEIKYNYLDKKKRHHPFMHSHHHIIKTLIPTKIYNKLHHTPGQETISCN